MADESNTVEIKIEAALAASFGAAIQQAISQVSTITSTVNTINENIAASTDKITGRLARTIRRNNQELVTTFRDSFSQMTLAFEGFTNGMAQSMERGTTRSTSSVQRMTAAMRKEFKLFQDSVNLGDTQGRIDKMVDSYFQSGKGKIGSAGESAWIKQLRLEEKEAQALFKRIKIFQESATLGDTQGRIDKMVASWGSSSGRGVAITESNSLLFRNESKVADAVIQQQKRVQVEADKTRIAQERAAERAAQVQIREAKRAADAYQNQQNQIKQGIINTIAHSLPFGIGRTIAFTGLNFSHFTELEASAKAAGIELSGIDKLIVGLSRGISAIPVPVLVGLVAVVMSIAEAFNLAKSAVTQFIIPALKKGFEYHDLIDNTRLGMAGLVFQMTDIYKGQEKITDQSERWNGALQISDKLVAQLQNAALKTKATFSDIARGMQEGLGPMLQAGVSEDQITPFVTRFIQTMSTLRVPLREMGQEMRAFFNLESNPRTARVSFVLIGEAVRAMGVEIGEAKKRLRELKAEGRLDEWFMENTKGMERSGQSVMETLSGYISNIKEAWERVLGEGVSKQFPKLMEVIDDVYRSLIQFNSEGKVIFNPTIIAAIDTAAKAFVNVARTIVDLGNKILGPGGLVDTFKTFRDGINNNPIIQTIKFVLDLGGLAGLIKDATWDALKTGGNAIAAGYDWLAKKSTQWHNYAPNAPIPAWANAFFNPGADAGMNNNLAKDFTGTSKRNYTTGQLSSQYQQALNVKENANIDYKTQPSVFTQSKLKEAEKSFELAKAKLAVDSLTGAFNAAKAAVENAEKQPFVGVGNAPKELTDAFKKKSKELVDAQKNLLKLDKTVRFEVTPTALAEDDKAAKAANKAAEQFANEQKRAREDATKYYTDSARELATLNLEAGKTAELQDTTAESERMRVEATYALFLAEQKEANTLTDRLKENASKLEYLGKDAVDKLDARAWEVYFANVDQKVAEFNVSAAKAADKALQEQIDMQDDFTKIMTAKPTSYWGDGTIGTLFNKYTPEEHAQQIQKQKDEQRIAAENYNKFQKEFWQGPMTDIFTALARKGAKGFLEVMASGFDNIIGSSVKVLADALANGLGFGGKMITNKGGQLYHTDPLGNTTTPLTDQEAQDYANNQRRTTALANAGLGAMQIGFGAYQMGRTQYKGSITQGMIGGATTGAGLGFQYGALAGGITAGAGLLIGAIAGLIIGGIAAAMGKAETRAQYKFSSVGIGPTGLAYSYPNKNITEADNNAMRTQVQEKFDQFWNGFINLAVNFGNVTLPKFKLILGNFQTQASGHFLDNFQSWLNGTLPKEIGAMFKEPMTNIAEQLGMNADKFRDLWDRFQTLSPDKIVEILGILFDALKTFTEIKDFRTTYGGNDALLGKNSGFNNLVSSNNFQKSYSATLSVNDEKIRRLAASLSSLTGEAQIRQAQELGNLTRQRMQAEVDLAKQVYNWLKQTKDQISGTRSDLKVAGMGKMVTDENGNQTWVPDNAAIYEYYRGRSQEDINNMHSAKTVEEAQYWKDRWFQDTTAMGNAAQAMGPQAYQDFIKWMTDPGGALEIVGREADIIAARWGDEISSGTNSLFADIQPAIDTFTTELSSTTEPLDTFNGRLGSASHSIQRLQQSMEGLAGVINGIIHAEPGIGINSTTDNQSFTNNVIIRRVTSAA